MSITGPNGVSYNFGLMTKAADDMQKKNETDLHKICEDFVNEINTSIDGVNGTVWNGNQADIFSSHFKEDLAPNFETIEENINKIAQMVRDQRDSWKGLENIR